MSLKDKDKTRTGSVKWYPPKYLTCLCLPLFIYRWCLKVQIWVCVTPAKHIALIGSPWNLSVRSSFNLSAESMPWAAVPVALSYLQVGAFNSYLDEDTPPHDLFFVMEINPYELNTWLNPLRQTGFMSFLASLREGPALSLSLFRPIWH